MAQGSATVKQVVSGDTLVLMGAAQNGPPPTMQLSLASVVAPRLGRAGDRRDEPFAWQSREVLRKMLIGRVVQFKVLYHVDAIDRDFGDVVFEGQNVAVEMARAGWVKARPSRDGQQSAAFDAITAAAGEAEAAGKGVWTKDAAAIAGAVRTLDASDAGAIAAALTGSKLPAVVEHVRDGASVRAYIPSTGQTVAFNIAGIQCPRMNSAPAGRESKGEDDGAPVAAGGAPAAPKPQPFAAEARHFTETRLLNRDVLLHINGADKFSNLVGDVEFPAGNIAIELLKVGLAKVADFSLGQTAADNVVKYRTAERAAKLARMRLWHAYTPTTSAPSAKYNGTVVEVVSGNCVIVALDGPLPHEERRVYLASVRAPRMGRGEEPADKYAWEAKEFVRKLAAGRPVSVTVDFMRALPQGGAPTAQATVIVQRRKPVSIGEAVISEGLANVVRHRQDEDRSSQYDELVLAEERAKVAKKNLHSDKDPAPHRIADVSSNGTKAKNYLPFLQRQRTMKATVDYVFSGARFKVVIPAENCAVMFALSGVRCPVPGRAGAEGRARTAEPYGDEAWSFVRKLINQQDVEVEVEGMDKNGVALGTLWFFVGEDKKSLALELVTRGMGKLIPAAAARSRLAEELQTAENAAKKARIGVWTNYVEETESKEEKPKVMQVRVCEIRDGGHFYVQSRAAADAATLAHVEQVLAHMKEEFGLAGSAVEIKKNALVAASFNDGGANGAQWFRALVEGKEEDSVKILYVDYGNRETVPMSRLRPLDATITRLPALATPCTHAFVRVPTVSDPSGEDAAILFNSLAWGKDLIARIHGRDANGSTLVSLIEEGHSTFLVSRMLAEGLARLAKSEIRYAHDDADLELIAAYSDAQASARASRAGMFYMGDVPDSDDEL